MKRWLLLVALAALSHAQLIHAKPFHTERWQTKNGAQVVFYQAMEVPMLEVNIAFAAGSAYDGKHFGLSALTTQLLDQGNGNLNATQIAENFADIGAQFNSDTSRDMVSLQLKTLSNEEALQQAIATLALIINKPVFKQEALNREKNQQIMAITHMKQSPNEVANLAFFNKLYQKQPYAHSVKGTVTSIKALTTNQIRDFYRRYFVASNAVIVMVGAIDSNKAHELAEQLVANLPKGQAAPPVPKATPLTSTETVKIHYPSSQTMLRIGQVGINHSDPDYFSLITGNYILGGGSLVSKLSHEIREKRGLTYGVDSQFLPMPGDGPFIISLSTQNKQAPDALKVAEDTLASFLATGPDEAELLAAKQYLVGSFPLSLASNSNIAGLLLRIAFYHLPDDYLNTYTARIEAVTTADIKKSFASHIQPDKMLHVLVGANE